MNGNNYSNYSVESKLNDFKNNNLNVNDLEYYLAFKSVYYFNNEATDEEVIDIASAGYDAWLKDNEGYSVCKFSDFLACNYYDGVITLEDIENASKWDILYDSIDGYVYNILKDKEESMEI